MVDLGACSGSSIRRFADKCEDRVAPEFAGSGRPRTLTRARRRRSCASTSVSQTAERCRATMCAARSALGPWARSRCVASSSGSRSARWLPREACLPARASTTRRACRRARKQLSRLQLGRRRRRQGLARDLAVCRRRPRTCVSLLGDAGGAASATRRTYSAPQPAEVAPPRARGPPAAAAVPIAAERHRRRPPSPRTAVHMAAVAYMSTRRRRRGAAEPTTTRRTARLRRSRRAAAAAHAGAHRAGRGRRRPRGDELARARAAVVVDARQLGAGRGPRRCTGRRSSLAAPSGWTRRSARRRDRRT